MRRKKIIGSVLLAGILTVMLVAFSLLLLMATVREAGESGTALFGGVFFRSTPADDGTLGLEAGVDNPLVVLAVWAGLSASIFSVRYAYDCLARYRATLQARGDA